MDFTLMQRYSSSTLAIYDIQSDDLKPVGTLIMFKGTYIVISNWKLNEDDINTLTQKFL